MRKAPADPAPAYRDAGVDLGAADAVKRRLSAILGETTTPDVVDAPGGFGGALRLPDRAGDSPVIVASTDGVGTKVLVAQQANVHDTVGEDLVNHCVDDLLASWARPLLFLDYIATGRLDPTVVLDLVRGFARGCSAAGMPLLGGETAEMPDVYPAGVYDLAGFIVGLRVDRSHMESPPRPGDAVVGLRSSGLHTNGYTLARRIVFEQLGHRVDEQSPWGRETWGQALLRVHRSYLGAVDELLEHDAVTGIAHITGGGFEGNLPRVLPAGVGARIVRGRWDPDPLFSYMADRGQVEPDEMYRVFNMGIGLCLIVREQAVDAVLGHCRAKGEDVCVIGDLVAGDGVVWA